MRNLKSLLILFIVATSIFLIFPHKSFAGFSCSASGSTATFSLTGCPNPKVPALKFGAKDSFAWWASTIRSPYAQCSYPAFVGSLSSGYYYFGAYDSNNFSWGGCSVSIVGSGGSVILPPPPPSTGTISVSISGISSASYTITGPTTITGTNSATYSSEPAGTYTIVWGAVAGYTSPSPQSLGLISGGTITFSGTYVPPPTGTIAVSISGISSASYTITGPTTITGTNSATYSSEPAGTYTIVWGAVAGYTSPSSQSYTLGGSGTITFSGTYVQTGTVVVIVSGARVSSWGIGQMIFAPCMPPGACGSIFSTEFLDHGSSKSYALTSGSSHTIVWNAVTGYTTPASQTFTVPSSGGKITLTGTYIATPNLTAGSVTPVTTTTGTATSFSSSVNNIGSGNSVVYGAVTGTYPTSYGGVADSGAITSDITYDSKQNAIWKISNDLKNISKIDASNGSPIGTIYGTLVSPPSTSGYVKYSALTYDVTQNAVWGTTSGYGRITELNASTGATLKTYDYFAGNRYVYSIAYDVTQNAVWLSGDNLVELNALNGNVINTYSLSFSDNPITYDVTQNAVWGVKEKWDGTRWIYTVTKLNITNGSIVTYDIPYRLVGALTYDSKQNAVWIADGTWDGTTWTFSVTELNASNGNVVGHYSIPIAVGALTYDSKQNAVWGTDKITSFNAINVIKLDVLTGATIATYNTTGDDITYDSKQNAIWIGDNSAGFVTSPSTAYTITDNSRENVTKLDASTGPGFNNFFQVATAADGGGTITDLASSTMSVLAAGGSAVATSSPYTFATAGTYSVRACADNTSSAGGGVVPESNENNNCGAWTNITVTTTSGTPTGSITTNDCTITSGSTCPATVSWTTSNATSTSIQQNGIEFSTSLSGNTSRNISYGLNTFMLFNGLSLLDTKYAVGSVSDQGKTGTANGTTRDTAPSTYAELCASGTASAVTTTANGWSWTCGSGIGIVNGMATKTSTAVCGNSTCESPETLLSCPQDCKGKIQQF